MNNQEIIENIKRVKDALAKTKSPYLKRDYTKHLKRLQKMLKGGEKHKYC